MQPTENVKAVPEMLHVAMVPPSPQANSSVPSGTSQDPKKKSPPEYGRKAASHELFFRTTDFQHATDRPRNLSKILHPTFVNNRYTVIKRSLSMKKRGQTLSQSER